MFNCFSFNYFSFMHKYTYPINHKLAIFQTLKTKTKHKVTNYVNHKLLQLLILITNNNNEDNVMPEFPFLNCHHKHG